MVSTPISTANTTFASYFVQSWSAYETNAANLLNTSRYSSQVANLYFELNGNSSFDAGIDVDLRNNPLENSGVHFAHAAGLTGNGEIVAISDSGFLTTHEALQGSIEESHTSAVSDHGTFVASVVTGDSSTMIGTAPASKLIIGDTNTYQSLVDVGEAALRLQAVAWNNSWGFTNAYANTTDFNTYFGSVSGQAAFNAYKNYAAYGNVVFALSNNASETQADLVGGLPILDSALESGWIAVVNGSPTLVNNDVTSVQRISSACLNAARWCITADGTWYGAESGSTTTYDYGYGTSYAAPLVSGALALLAQAFPSLDPHDLRLRLFATADNTFAGFTTDQVVTLAPGYESAVSNEWGHGFIDVAAALLPIGEITVKSGNGSTIDASKPMVKAGTASGGAIAAALADVELRATDAFAGAFTLDATDLVQAVAPSSLFTAHNAALQTTGSVEERSLSAALFDRDPTVQNLIGDLQVSTYLPMYSDQNETAGISIGQRHDTAFGHIDWQAGVGTDNGALLPLWQNENGQNLASLGVSLSRALSETASLNVSAVMASAAASGNTSSVFMNSGEISFTQAQVFDRNDRLKMSIRQPFAVTSGATNLTLALNSAGGGTLQTLAVDLAPKDREVQIAFDYEIETARDTDLMLSLVHAANRGHVSGAHETGVFFGMKRDF